MGSHTGLMMKSDLMDWVTHTAKKEIKKKLSEVTLALGLKLVDRHAHVNQTFYFQHVLLGGDDGGPLLNAIFDGCQVMDGSVGLRVLQEAQVFFGLLVFEEVDSARGGKGRRGRK